jgi:hypothetical protein
MGGRIQNLSEKGPDLPNTIKYLGFHLSQGQHRLSPERKQAICSIPTPNTLANQRVFGS